MSAPLSERNLTIMGLLGSILTLTVGLLVFWSRYEFAEQGHDILAIIFMVACIGLFFGVRLWNIPILIVALFTAITVQIYASNKFGWRENYIQLAQMGQPFPLDEFIDHFPTYEEYTFRFLKAPDWVRFNEECVQPSLTNQVVPPRCANFDLIERYYHVDVRNAMSLHFGKMKKTAKMIQDGKMNKRSAYIDCISNKVCAAIPLLPKGVDAAQIEQNSKDYIGIRQAFWSLVDDKKMSPQVCSLTPLCRALVNMKAVEPGKLPF